MTIGHLAAGAVALGAVVAAALGGALPTRTPARRPGGVSTQRGFRPGRHRPFGSASARRFAAPAPIGARWARASDLAPLLCAPTRRGRLALGEVGRRPVVAEVAQSLAVIGPSQSGKTTALAVPAILRWDGPVLAASVKTDLVRDTLSWRQSCGRVWCFDPTGTTGLPQSPWSPVSAAATWTGARRVAAHLTAVTRAEGTTADGEFWYAMAAKLLAPLLFAAAVGGRSMLDVARWVDTQETEEVADLLHAAGVAEALQAARATWLRDERTRSSVYTTAETVLEPFAEPGLVLGALPAQPAPPAPGLRGDDTPPYGVPPCEGRAAAAAGAPADPTGSDIDPAGLLSGAHTLYVCAPAHDQRRLRAVFSALVEQVLEAAFARASSLGRPLDPPLLVVLDEAANIAPLRELDGLAATCAGHGVQLVTVWQDLAQVRARYGERASTVVNNHRAKLFLPGIADPATLDFASHLAGDCETPVPSVSVGARGERTHTTSAQVRRLLPADALRRLAPGSAVLLYGTLPPARLRLRPWFAHGDLVSRGGGAGGATAREGYSPSRDGRGRRGRSMGRGRGIAGPSPLRRDLQPARRARAVHR